MDLQSLYYFVETAKDLNFTHTAHRLFISQQTLSNYIARLEREYGVQLFERKPKVALTAVGAYFLPAAEKLLAEEHDLRQALLDFGAQERGTLRVGAPSHRASLLLPEVLPVFCREFPQVQIEFSTHLSHRLEEMLLNGEIDLAIGAFPGAPNLEQTAFLRDVIYITASERLLQQYYGEAAQKLKERARERAHVEDFAELPFILPSIENRQTNQLYRCFDAAHVQPRCFMTTTFPQFFFSLCEGDLAAMFLSETHFYSKLAEMKEGICRFPLYLEEEPVYHTISVAYRKGRRLTRYARRFIEIVESYFKKVEEQRLLRL